MDLNKKCIAYEMEGRLCKEDNWQEGAWGTEEEGPLGNRKKREEDKMINMYENSIMYPYHDKTAM